MESQMRRTKVTRIGLSAPGKPNAIYKVNIEGAVSPHLLPPKAELETIPPTIPEGNGYNAGMSIDFGVTAEKAALLRARMAACGLLEEELEESFVRSGGPGGQKVNRTSTCVYLKHRPTGLEVKMQRERRQGLNRYYARKRLCELLESRRLGKQSPAAIGRAKIRKQKSRRRRRSHSKPTPA